MICRRCKHRITMLSDEERKDHGLRFHFAHGKKGGYVVAPEGDCHIPNCKCKYPLPEEREEAGRR